MVENLLYIAKVFLNELNTSKFTEEGREQLLNTVRKIVFFVLIELREKEVKMQQNMSLYFIENKTS